MSGLKRSAFKVRDNFQVNSIWALVRGGSIYISDKVYWGMIHRVFFAVIIAVIIVVVIGFAILTNNPETPLPGPNLVIYSPSQVSELGSQLDDKIIIIKGVVVSALSPSPRLSDHSYEVPGFVTPEGQIAILVPEKKFEAYKMHQGISDPNNLTEITIRGKYNPYSLRQYAQENQSQLGQFLFIEFIEPYVPKTCSELKCNDFRYGNCPVGCIARCIPSSCNTGFCTTDCGGRGSCACS